MKDENYLLKKLMEFIKNKEEKFTFEIEDYGGEKAALIRERNVDCGLNELNGKKDCNYTNLRGIDYKGGVDTLTGIANLYGVFYGVYERGANSSRKSISVFPLGRGLIDFLDEEKEEIHNKNILSLKECIFKYVKDGEDLRFVNEAG